VLFLSSYLNLLVQNGKSWEEFMIIEREWTEFNDGVCGVREFRWERLKQLDFWGITGIT
jgi:hypothetical protein